MLDCSLAMAMRDLSEPARTSAAATARHIGSRSAHTLHGAIAFAEEARQVPADELEGTPHDQAYGTNLMAAVVLGQGLLGHKPGRLVVFSTFEPSAHGIERRDIFFSYPPTPETVTVTIEQIGSAEREGILIDAFCFDMVPRSETKTVLEAVNDAGGHVIHVNPEDAETRVRTYLEKVWP